MASMTGADRGLGLHEAPPGTGWSAKLHCPATEASAPRARLPTVREPVGAPGRATPLPRLTLRRGAGGAPLAFLTLKRPSGETPLPFLTVEEACPRSARPFLTAEAGIPPAQVAFLTTEEGVQARAEGFLTVEERDPRVSGDSTSRTGCGRRSRAAAGPRCRRVKTRPPRVRTTPRWRLPRRRPLRRSLPRRQPFRRSPWATKPRQLEPCPRAIARSRVMLRVRPFRGADPFSAEPVSIED